MFSFPSPFNRKSEIEAKRKQEEEERKKREEEEKRIQVNVLAVWRFGFGCVILFLLGFFCLFVLFSNFQKNLFHSLNSVAVLTASVSKYVSESRLATLL